VTIAALPGRFEPTDRVEMSLVDVGSRWRL
jgi:hypothetical protein